LAFISAAAADWAPVVVAEVAPTLLVAFYGIPNVTVTFFFGFASTLSFCPIKDFITFYCLILAGSADDIETKLKC